MKKQLYYYPVIVLMVAMLFPVYTIAQARIPATWQPGMKLTANYSGGQSTYSYNLEITEGVSTFKLRSQDNMKNYKKTFSKEELDNILKYLVSQKFDKIKATYTGFTHDKASQSIILSWGSESIGVSENSNQTIIEGYRPNFLAIEQYLQDQFDSSRKK